MPEETKINPLLLMTAEARVRATAAKQIEKQGALRWAQDNARAGLTRHVALLFGVPMDDPRVTAFYADCDVHGFGTNASQFRQWLESAEVAMLPATPKAKLLADTLLKE